MNIGLKRHQAISIAFLALSLASVTYVAYATLNYLPFWPALDQLQVHISRVVLSGANDPSQTVLTIRYQVNNPSDYSEFEVYDAFQSIYFAVPDNSSIILPLSLLSTSPVRTTLGANANMSRDIVVPLTYANATSLDNYNTQYGSRLVAKVALTVDIVTFLNSVTGHIHLTDSGDFPLSTS